MFSIRLFFACRRWNCSPAPFFSPHLFMYLCSLRAFVFNLPSDFFCKLFLFLSPSSFPRPSFWLLCPHSNRAMHPPYSFSQRGTSLAIGSLTSSVGVGLSERKIKAIPFIVRFPLFLLGESRAHRMDSEHGALLLSRITTGNVFPCDVTVNNFSAKGNKSVDFGAVCTFSDWDVYSQKYVFRSYRSFLCVVFSWCFLKNPVHTPFIYQNTSSRHGNNDKLHDQNVKLSPLWRQKLNLYRLKTTIQQTHISVRASVWLLLSFRTSVLR